MEPEIHDKQEDRENSVGGIEVEPETLIAVKSEDTEIVSAELRPKGDILQRCEVSEEEGKAKEAEVDTNDSVIDIERGDGSPSLRAEKVCRICHLSCENTSQSSELIQLGCSCKDELGVSHLQCAETWFLHKGNRQCEICGKTARNITGIEDIRFMVEWNEMRLMAANAANSSRRERSCLSKNFCNFLLVCLVLAFILPWFFRIDML